MGLQRPNPYNPEEVRRWMQRGGRQYVPYSGALYDVDLGSFNLTTTGIGSFGKAVIDSITIDAASIVSSTNAIAFGPAVTINTNSPGVVAIGNLTIGPAQIISDTGVVDFDNENITTTGVISNGTISLTGAAITSSTGAISFSNENLSTSGTLAVGTMLISSGSITDSGGSVNFGDEDIGTTGYGVFGSIILYDGNLTSITGTIDLANEDLTTTGTVTGNNFHTYGGQITSATGTISFVDEDLTTTGSMTAGLVSVDNITIDSNEITSDTGEISFGDDNMETSGSITAGTTLTMASGSITDTGGAIDFGNETLTTTGNVYLHSDAARLYMGAGDDAYLYFDGSYLNINANTDNYHFSGNAHVGIYGTPTVNAGLNVGHATTITGASQKATANTLYYGAASSSNTASRHYGMYNDARTAGNFSGTATSFWGENNTVTHNGSNTLAEAVGAGCGVTLSGSGDITNAIGNLLFIADGGAGTIATATGLYIQSITQGTTNWAIRSFGGNSHHVGNVNLGTTGTPTEVLEVHGNIFIHDNEEMIFGTGKDAKIDYNGTDMIVKPDAVGSGAVQVEGDMRFSGSGTGLPYGEIYAYDSNTTITITATGIANKVQVTAFDTNGASNQMTPDHTNDHITVTKAGVYLCTVSISAESVGGVAYEVGFSVFKNNGATQLQNLHVHRNLSGAGGDTGSLSMSGLITLAANDTIEVWTYNETNTSNIIVDDITLSLVQVGG